MAFTRVTAATDNVSNLPNKPNENGYTASSLKAVFDAVGAALKTYINDTLLAELEGTTAAGNIGIASITGMTADDVQEALEELYTDVSNAVLGGIPDGSLTTAKYADASVTSAKLGSSSVQTAKIADSNVTTAKIADANVTTAKLASGAVTSDKLGAGAVTTAKITDGNVTTAKLADAAVTYAKTSGVQQKHIATSASIPAISLNGSQTVSVSGVTASNTVIISPAASSFEEWRDCGVRCTAQSAGTLTFESDTATTNTLTANVVILNL